MDKLTIFYQPLCPFCKKAFKFIEELKEENPEFGKIEIETIDEIKNAALADTYDYYYVPTFYVGKKKIHEGGIFKDEVRELLQSVLDGTEFKVSK